MSLHWLAVGASGAGKSRVMKQIIIPAHRRRGRRVAVCDPLGFRDWGADFVTDDPEKFIAGAKALRDGWVLVVDEWPHIMETDRKAAYQLVWCYTVARNFGHLAYALGQSPNWIPLNVRRQCMQGFFFKDRIDAPVNAQTVGCPELELCQYLRNGEAIIVANGRVIPRFGRRAIFPDLPAKDETPIIPVPDHLAHLFRDRAGMDLGGDGSGMLVKSQGGPAAPSRRGAGGVGRTHLPPGALP